MEGLVPLTTPQKSTSMMCSMSRTPTLSTLPLVHAGIVRNLVHKCDDGVYVQHRACARRSSSRSDYLRAERLLELAHGFLHSPSVDTWKGRFCAPFGARPTLCRCPSRPRVDDLAQTFRMSPASTTPRGCPLRLVEVAAQPCPEVGDRVAGRSIDL